MSLKEQIDSDLKKAMLTKNKDDLRALRAIKSLILLAETENERAGGLDNITEIKLLTKAAKQRKDSIQIYLQQGREDLASKEQQELDVIMRYLPEQLSETEIESELNNIIKTTGSAGPKDIGKVIGIATKQLAGKADGRIIANVAKRLLK